MMMAQAGLRTIPEKLEKSALDLWHRPKRVDTVLQDPYFEALVQPGSVESKLSSDIEKLASRIETEINMEIIERVYA
jgi:hypothetical protein